NADLQQFAYISSHDLQEPLRMIKSYTQLLAKRYEGRLDATADEFIRFVIDGVHRMEDLIRDLLVYSRVIHTEQPEPESIPVQEVVRAALQILQPAIDETRAAITIRSLPAVPCDRTQLVQVFQNLFSNALKYRGENVPHIVVDAEP